MILQLTVIDQKHKRKKNDKRTEDDSQNYRTMTAIETLIEIFSQDNQSDDSREYFKMMS
jgi:hypothetical protein